MGQSQRYFSANPQNRFDVSGVYTPYVSFVSAVLCSGSPSPSAFISQTNNPTVLPTLHMVFLCLTIYLFGPFPPFLHSQCPRLHTRSTLSTGSNREYSNIHIYQEKRQQINVQWFELCVVLHLAVHDLWQNSKPIFFFVLLNYCFVTHITYHTVCKTEQPLGLDTAIP